MPTIRHRLLRVVFALVVLLTLAATILAGLHVWAHRWLERTRQAVEASGSSLDLADFLNRLDENAPNASPALDELSKIQGDARGGSSREFLDAGLEALEADLELRERAAAWLERPEHREAFVVLKELETAEGASLTDDVATAVRILTTGEYDRLGVLRAARLLGLRAWLRGLESRTDEAYGDAVLLLRLGGFLHQEAPGLLSWMLGNAVLKTALETLEALGTIARPDAELRARIASVIESSAARRPSWGLEGDRALAATAWRLAAEGHPVAAETPRIPGTIWNAWVNDAFTAQYLEAYNELVRQAPMAPSERPGFEALLEDDSRFMIPAGILVPNLLDAIDKDDATRTRLDLARFALAWLEHHESPGSPAPEISVDRFTGQPLHFRSDPTGCLVYSVGVNRIDDGGENAGTPVADDPDDLVWRLPCDA